LSSAESGVWHKALDIIKEELTLLVARGAKCIKFVDRTFNADKKRAGEILEFVRGLDTGCVFHFEAAGDLFDDKLFAIIQKMPPGKIQFEIGIQSTNPATLAAVNRKTDISVALSGIKRLMSFGNCHIHADLIAGLPKESYGSFAKGFDLVLDCKPHMLQLGFLKLLKGTKLREDAEAFGAVYSDHAPYEVYKTDTMDFGDILKLKRIEGALNKYYNSGRFERSVEYGAELFGGSWFGFFEKLAEKDGYRTSMKNAYSMLFEFLTLYGDADKAVKVITEDSLKCEPGGGSLPDKLKYPAAQARHLSKILEGNKKEGQKR